jgi:hypothetical protein
MNDDATLKITREILEDIPTTNNRQTYDAKTGVFILRQLNATQTWYYH